MLCEHCHKNIATVFLKKTVNGKTTEIRLCEKCAKELEGINMDSDLSFQNLLSGFINASENNLYGMNQFHHVIPTCSHCGMNYTEFRKTGKLGCAHCYDTFSKTLMPVIKRIHGNTIHSGKIPNRTGGKLRINKRIQELQEQLHMAIAKEEYERAAQLRDEIRTLKKED